LHLSLVTIAASKRLGVPSVSKLREIFVVDVIGHRDHESRRLLDRILIGREINLPGLRILFVTVSARYTEVCLIATHQLIDIVSGNILWQYFQVLRRGIRNARSRSYVTHRVAAAWGLRYSTYTNCEYDAAQDEDSCVSRFHGFPS
jgi:hypothetical protein